MLYMAAWLMIAPFYAQADSDSEFRAEVLGEQGGKSIAVDHNEHQPEKTKKACSELFFKAWEGHFKEKGFDTDEATVTTS
jgi:hypothetical protein